jgi:hypothetical protein
MEGWRVLLHAPKERAGLRNKESFWQRSKENEQCDV